MNSGWIGFFFLGFLLANLLLKNWSKKKEKENKYHSVMPHEIASIRKICYPKKAAPTNFE